MSYGLYISAAGADTQRRRMEVLSNNLANVDTAGFKRELAIPQARHSEAISQGMDNPGSRSINDVGGGVRMNETVTDFGMGVLKKTGLPTDLAINGDGFFVVEKEGQRMLTRAGNFQFTADGRLVTQSGDPVLSVEGAPVEINPTLPWQVLTQGAIEQGGNAIQLAIMKPRSLGDLVKVGETLFSPLAAPQDVAPEARHVVNGYLEGSTVSPTTEMMQLIETSRAYEANIKMIQNHDSVIGSLLNRILKSS